MGLYPNRHVADAAFSVVVDGGTVDARQINVHASRRAPTDRADANEVGPITVEVLEPLHALRLVVEAPEHGLRADLTFVRRSAPIEEPHFRHQVGMRVMFDYTRLTQFGGWEGWVEVDGELIDLDPGETWGSRDRSWGVRPVGERGSTGAPIADPQFFWLWAPINFDTFSTHFDVNELFDGKRWHETGRDRPGRHRRRRAAGSDAHDGLPASAGARAPGTRNGSRSTWCRGSANRRRSGWSRCSTSRCSASATATPTGATACGRASWPSAATVGTCRSPHPNAYEHVHIQAIVRATTSGGVGEHEGIGILEQLALGRHDPTGLDGLLDGWRRRSQSMLQVVHRCLAPMHDLTCGGWSCRRRRGWRCR